MPDRPCFYCGVYAPKFLVTVGRRDFPICSYCVEHEAPKDFFAVRKADAR